MKIGTRDLDQRALVIAEIGNNHEGSRELALELVDAAATAGADAVKIQVIDPERLVHRSQSDRIAQLSRFRLPPDVWQDMADLARQRGLLFLASAFDLDSLHAIAPLVPAVKIASGDLDFTPLLEAAAALDKPLILSTGMATLDEVGAAVDVIARHLPHGTVSERLVLLHCVSLYPMPLPCANLSAIRTLAETFQVTVGYSDHAVGIEGAVLALSQGARVIEKHFTLDKSRTSHRDHALSADPDDMRRLAVVAHEYERIVGTGEKAPSDAELEMARAARRSVVAARDLPAGTRLAERDLDYVRPRDGSAPRAARSMMGRRLRVALEQHALLKDEHLEPEDAPTSCAE